MVDTEKRIPARKSNFQLEEIDGEILLYSPESTTTVYLNESAAIIWQLCDGKTSVAEISDAIAHESMENPDTIKRDVGGVIDQLLDQEIITLADC